MAGAIGCAPAPSPVLSAPRGERQPPLECLAKPCSAPCHVFAPFSTGVGQKIVDNSNAKPTIYETADKARRSKTPSGSGIRLPFPSKALFAVVDGVRSPPKAASKEEKNSWFGVPV
jgi:hypothetical protein